MLSRYPRLAAATRAAKRRLRRPLLSALRAWPGYRALARLPRNEIASCREYVRERGAPDAYACVHPAERLNPAPASVDPGDGARLFFGLTQFEFPETFVARLHGCRLYSRGVAVIGADERVLAEGSVHIGGTSADHAVMGRAWLPAPERLHGTTVVLSAPAGATYYHWMFDILPRIELLRASGFEWAEADRIVVNSFRRAYQRETFESLGVPARKVVEGDTLRHAWCERMVLPSYPGISGFPPRWACAYLRSLLAGPEPHRRRLYVSRAKSRGRGVANETEVRTILERAGFETVFPEEMPVAEQARCFASASAVVAPHGSGLSNLVFCEPGTAVVELFPPEFAASHYWVLSRQLGLRYQALIAEAERALAPLGDFRIDPAKLAQAISRTSP